MGHGVTELDAELHELKIHLARRIRERLEADGPVPPAFLDVARRFLLDHAPKVRPAAPPPPLITDLPFPDEIE